MIRLTELKVSLADVPVEHRRAADAPAETDRGLIIANFNGVYRLSSAVLTGGELQARIIIDDIGPEAGVDGLRCCNGAGNSKGALWQGKVYLPSLNGLVSVDLAGLSDQVPVPQVLLEEIKVGQTSWPLAQPLVIDRTHKPFTSLVVGVNGSGKTTTIGKLAQRYGADFGVATWVVPAVALAAGSAHTCSRSSP